MKIPEQYAQSQLEKQHGKVEAIYHTKNVQRR